MSDSLNIDGREARLISLAPGQALTGVISGFGPQVTLHRRAADDPDGDDTGVLVDTVLFDQVGESSELVALIVNRRLAAAIRSVAAAPALRSGAVKVTLSAEDRTTPRGSRVIEYRFGVVADPESWQGHHEALWVATRVARRRAGRELTPSLVRAVEIVVRLGVVRAGQRAVDGRAPPSVIQALARRGVVDLVEVGGVLSGVFCASFHEACRAELAIEARPATAADLLAAVRDYLAALEDRRAHGVPADSSAPIRGRALVNLSAERQRRLDQAEAVLRRTVSAFEDAEVDEACPGTHTGSSPAVPGEGSDAAVPAAYAGGTPPA